ncbi:MAG TPA: hypothetical protein VK446_15620 [Methylocystis sp.]|nr:hypothetical protein [Methylocystis sp.]
MLARSVFLVATAFFVASTATAALPQDRSDWPCRQVKVPELSLAAIWSGPPVDEARTRWPDDAAVSELATRLAARRTPIEEAGKLIAEFARVAGDARRERLVLLFAAVFDKLDAERAQVLVGLERFGRTQKQAAERLRRETEELRQSQEAHESGETIRQRSQALEMDLRVFDERRQTLTYVCESPTLIEQRLGALAREIEAALP